MKTPQEYATFSFNGSAHEPFIDIHRLQELNDAFSAYNKEMHSHDFYCIAFPRDCHGTHYIGLDAFEIKPNRVFFIPPGVLHTCEGISATSTGLSIIFNEALMGLFDLQTYNKINKDIFSPYTPAFCDIQEKDFEHFCNILFLLFDEINNKGVDAYGHFGRITSLLSLLLIDFKRKGVWNTANATPQGARSELAHKFREMVEYTYKDKLPLSYYASKLCVSVPTLNRFIREQMQISPSKYIKLRILREAKALLLSTQMSLKDIANELKFPNQASFSAFFKMGVGRKPQDFRDSF